MKKMRTWCAFSFVTCVKTTRNGGRWWMDMEMITDIFIFTRRCSLYLFVIPISSSSSSSCDALLLSLCSLACSPLVSHSLLIVVVFHSQPRHAMAQHNKAQHIPTIDRNGPQRIFSWLCPVEMTVGDISFRLSFFLFFAFFSLFSVITFFIFLLT